jgi:hypothetical protein
MTKYNVVMCCYDKILVRMLFYLPYLCICFYTINIYNKHLGPILLVRIKFNFTFVKYIFPVVIQGEKYANYVKFSVLEAW